MPWRKCGFNSGHRVQHGRAPWRPCPIARAYKLRSMGEHQILTLGVAGSHLSHCENNYALVEQPGVLACLSRRRSRVQIPSRALATNAARYANRQSGQAQTLVTAGSTPARATGTTCVGWASVSPTDCKSAATGCAGSTPARRTRYGSFVYRKDASPSSWKGRVQFPHGPLQQYDQVAELGYARRSERRALEAWEFESPLGH